MKIGRSDSDLLCLKWGKRETHSILIGVGHDKSNQIFDFGVSSVMPSRLFSGPLTTH